jgi:hypothetical protein
MNRADAVAMRINGNVDNVRLYNNAFLEVGVADSRLYERGRVFDTPATEAFRKKRGSGEPVISGAGNFVTTRVKAIPPELTDGVVAANPLFVDLLDLDVRPAKDSPLAGVAAKELPAGHTGDLALVFEPFRGIPADLDAPRRNDGDSPAIGPFSPAATRSPIGRESANGDDDTEGSDARGDQV